MDRLLQMQMQISIQGAIPELKNGINADCTWKHSFFLFVCSKNLEAHSPQKSASICKEHCLFHDGLFRVHIPNSTSLVC